MGKPTIGIIHYSCSPVIGGVENVIKFHTIFLNSHGYKTKILTGSGKKFRKRTPVEIIPQMSSLDELNQEINEELSRGVVSKRFEKRVDFFYEKICEFLKDVNICIIHNILTMYYNIPLTVALRKIIEENKKTKFIAWTHDLALKHMSYKSKDFDLYPYSILKKKLKNLVYVAISEYRQKQLANLLKMKKDSIIVVPDGIYLKNFLKLKMKTIRFFQHHRLFDDDLVLLYPSRLVHRKNFELAIRITKALNRCKKTSLVITAPPDPHNKDYIKYLHELKELAKKLKIEKKIAFLSEFEYKGKKIEPSQAIIHDLYNLCDLLLFTSKQEGFGIPLLEAGLSRMPVACTTIPAFKEVGNTEVCYINLKDSPSKSAKKILSYLEHSTIPSFFRKLIHEYRWHVIFHEKIEPLLK